MDFWDPRVRDRGLTPLHYHLLVALGIVAALIVLSLSAIEGVRYGRAYFERHYRAPLPIPTYHAPVLGPRVALPASAAIHFKYFATGINDQGQIGACQAWAAAKQISYAYNWNRPHHHRFFSPRFLYDAVSNGQDAGSYLEQYPPVISTQGVPQWKQMPYGGAAAAFGLPAYAVDYPIPPRYLAVAATHHLNLTEQLLFEYPGAGPGGLALIQAAVASHHAVNLDLPVYPEFDNANNTGYQIGPPQPGESPRGGHAVTIVGYRPGWVEISNQWGPYWGFSANGTSGLAWLSDAFVEQYGFGAAVLHVAPSSGVHVATPPVWDGGMKHHLVPGPPNVPRAPRTAAWYVGPVFARDAPVNLGALVNAAGDRYHVWPVGLLAIIGAECGLNTHSPECDRYGYWPDVSFGSCQVTVSTASGYGVGDGTGASTEYVRQYENDANRCIDLAARVLHAYQAYTGLNFPALAVAWNCGPGQPTWFLLNPTGECYTNHQNYLSWFSWALSQGYYPQPRPRPAFPLRLWNSYRVSHHQRPISAYLHGHLTWAASLFWGHTWVGGVAGPGQWYAGHPGYDRYPYAHAVGYCWPKTHRCLVKKGSS